ncbi:50S ribosomal protein L22, partial [bacterium]|nr:50S ribosomal protein L22 [bacterium]
MKVHASARFIRQSPYKVRRVLDLVRGLPVVEARNVLKFTQRRAADPISKTLESAVANASHNHA